MASVSELALEVDQVDVTNFLVFTQGRVSYTPVEHLSPGNHSIRLLRYSEDGEIIELGVWNAQVRQSAAFVERNAQIEGSLLQGYRVDRSEISPAESGSEYVSEGSLNLNFTGKGENSELRVRSHLLHSNNALAPSKELDLGDYEMTLSVGERQQYKLGHHALDHTSMIHQQFNRRGASGSILLPGIKSRVQAFALSPVDLSGFRGGLGLTDGSNYVRGAIWQLQPLTQQSERLSLTASYSTGKSSVDQGFGFIEQTAGEASSLSISSQWLDRRLKLSGEYAETRFDFDSGDASIGDEKAQARNLNVAYQSKARYEGRIRHWNIALNHLFVEPEFRSLSNPFFSADREATLLNAMLGGQNWSLQPTVSYEEDNVDNRFSATRTLLSTGLAFNFAPVSDPQAERQARFQSNYNVSLAHSKRGQLGTEFDLITGAALAEVDSANYRLDLGASHSANAFSVNWSIGTETVEDRADDANSYTSYSLTLGANFNVAEWQISPSVTGYVTSYDQTDAENDDYTYSLSVIPPFRASKFQGQFNISRNYRNDRYFDEGARNNEWYGQANLNYQLIEAKANFPGLKLQLSGHYRDAQGNSPGVLYGDGYQVFVSLIVAGSYQTGAVAAPTTQYMEF